MKHNVYLEFGKSRQGLVKNFKKSYPWLVAESNSATLEAFLRLEEIRLHRHLCMETCGLEMLLWLKTLAPICL